MEKISMTVDDLNAAIAKAVNDAFAAREGKRGSTLVSRKACAKRLHVAPSTLWRWHRTGYLRAVKLGGRTWYTEESILKIERGERNV